MNLTQLRQDFLPADLVLQLLRDMAPDQFQEKIALVEAHVAKIAGEFDPDVLFIRLHDQIGFIYWEAGRYGDAITHYTLVLTILQPGDHPFLYFHVACLLAQCHRNLGNYPESLSCAGQALKAIDHANSPFQALTVLKEYVLTLEAAQTPFDPCHLPLLDQIHAELQFPALQAIDPAGKVMEMKHLNTYWNRKLSLIYVETKTPEAQQAALLEFAGTCPIGWYRDHVKNHFPDREIF